MAVRLEVEFGCAGLIGMELFIVEKIHRCLDIAQRHGYACVIRGEGVNRDDRVVAPVTAMRKHGWIVDIDHGWTAPAEFGTLTPASNEALHPVQQ